jgi:acyl-CoA reductase-like NAD-dependent aldehyde dehydrogenase
VQEKSAQWQDAVFVDGEFRRPAGGGTIGVRDKATGEIFATAGLAGQADVDQAVAVAKQAQPAWSERTYAERAGLLRDVAVALDGRAKQYRELIMRETGCIGGKADYEISAAKSELIEAAGLASRATGEVLPTGHAGRFSLSERIPVGLVGVLTPWNFPLVLGIAEAYTRELAARVERITVGNTVTEDVGLGPMINERQLDRARQLLVEALEQGARIVAGGGTDGPFFRPTVVADVNKNSRLWTEEIFAPIAPISVVDDADEAVAVANDTDSRWPTTRTTAWSTRC